MGHDIARLLLDYTAILRSSKELENGQIVPADAIEAFFRGYRLVGPDDPSVQFLPYAKILGPLVNVPQRRNERSKTNQKTRSGCARLHRWPSPNQMHAEFCERNQL